MDLFEWINKSRITKVQIAKDLGISYSYFSKIRKKKSMIGVKVAKKIVAYTNGEVSLEDMRPDFFDV